MFQLGLARSRCRGNIIVLGFEADYKARFIQSADITLSALAENYMKDLAGNRKIDFTTAAKKQRIFETMIIPFFRHRKIN
ncbi:MAG: hypothetical protein HDQ99_20755 [Lachnospiraceae bacterium]|nr:hypothetical protein [Lachnospiraceae bacterium]